MKMIKKLILVVFIFYGLNSCNPTEPPGYKSSVALSVADISCTESWLKLSSNSLSLPANVELYNNNSLNQTINLTTADTILYVNSLLPNQTYNFHSVIQSINHSQITTDQLPVTTLDTTSNNFTWQTWTFGGQAGSCLLYDVAIVNDTCIYAVGEIYLLDSLGQPDPESYGVIHWNGSQWKLIKLKYNCRLYYPNCGPDTMLSTPAYSVFAYEPNDVWVSAGSIHHFDGIHWTEEAGIEEAGGAIKIWGSSDHQLWFVGHNGFIAHRSADGTWSRISSGTSININDVWGVVNPVNNQTIIYCAVSNVLEVSEHKILTIDENNKVDSVQWDTGRRVNSIWTDNPLYLYTSGGGVFDNKPGKWEEVKSLPLYYTNRIRGNGLNDIFVAGDFGLLAHFNGTRWKVFNEFLQLPLASFNLAVKGNIVVAVGYTGDKAFIVMGIRN